MMNMFKKEEDGYSASFDIVEEEPKPAPVKKTVKKVVKKVVKKTPKQSEEVEDFMDEPEPAQTPVKKPVKKAVRKVVKKPVEEEDDFLGMNEEPAKKESVKEDLDFLNDITIPAPESKKEEEEEFDFDAEEPASARHLPKLLPRLPRRLLWRSLILMPRSLRSLRRSLLLQSPQAREEGGQEGR